MEQQNFIEKIILELDMIRAMSRLTVFAIENESEETERGSIELVLEDIEERCWSISGHLEKLEKSLPVSD